MNKIPGCCIGNQSTRHIVKSCDELTVVSWSCLTVNLLKSTRAVTWCDKSSAVAEMGDRGHSRHGPKRGGVLCPFLGALGVGTRLIQCGWRRCLLPYQVASSSNRPFVHNSVGCHFPRRNISTNYYLVVEMHTVTVLSDDVWYFLN